MLDLKYVRKNLEEVKAAIAKKRVPFDLEKTLNTIVSLDEERRHLITKIEQLRAAQNQASQEIASASGEERKEKIAAMKEIASQQKELEPELKIKEKELKSFMDKLPNPAHSSVPEGESEEDNEVIATYGEVPQFDFKPKDHLDLGVALDLIDVKRAAKASGTRFAYLKNELVILEFALVQYALNKMISKGFVPVVPPVLVKKEAMYGTGFLPTDEAQIYKTVQDDLYLVGTSEVSLAALHINEILEEKDLPKRYTAFSTCFRREAGAYGKDTRGMFRVHQFDKIEMFSFCKPKGSWEEHEFLRSIEEEIMHELELSYQVVNICGGELGAPAAKKYDIEVWLPGQGRYRELTSCSNCTDFQARRLNCRVRTKQGNRILHTLNGTVVAVGRTLIALVENYQQKDGSIVVPEVLLPYTQGLKHIPAN